MSVIVWSYAVGHERATAGRCMARVLLPLAWLIIWPCAVWRERAMVARRPARVLLPLAWVIVWPCAVWHELAMVRRMARVLLPLAWLPNVGGRMVVRWYGVSELQLYDVWREYYCPWPGLSYGRALYGVSVLWLYVVSREYYCLWPGLPNIGHRMAVRCLA